MRSRSITTKTEDRLSAALMIFPYLGFITVFVIIPVIYAFCMSFLDWGFYNAPAYVGLANYIFVIKDGKFFDAMVVAIKYALIVVPSIFIFSFTIALLLKSLKGRLASVTKVAIYVPTVLSGVIASCIFVFIFDYMGGVANVIMKFLGLDPVPWLTTPGYAMAAIVVPTVWLGFGGTSLILLSGLNEIPQTYYEAASLDGAGSFRQLISITLPCMKNIAGYVLITASIGAIQALDLPMLMTNGGPLNTTTTPNLLIYQHFKADLTMGYTVAASMMLFTIVAMGSVLVFKLINSEKSMD